ncbi:hypothetical protein L1987_42744 [Smallanthus sonchifolius]|uniref:Uncharacterized protein n=1 Tax=Smallanthus sonchifolius TaxID=185202 RepID=A0ACB9GKF8_9ASTR|nr:hypothetical protein L1987_42744 [Smallanthus sonchifolius]
MVITHVDLSQLHLTILGLTTGATTRTFEAEIVFWAMEYGRKGNFCIGTIEELIGKRSSVERNISIIGAMNLVVVITSFYGYFLLIDFLVEPSVDFEVGAVDLVSNDSRRADKLRIGSEGT